MKIIKPEAPLPPKNLVVVIYGPPGVAKTSLSFTTDSPILFDFDEGVERSVGRKDVVKMAKYEEMVEIIEKNELADKGYKTAIIDTGGSCLDNFISDYVCRIDFKNKKGDGSLSLSGYGSAGVVFKKMVAYLKSCKMDLVIVCHGVEKEGAGDSLRLRPKLTGGSYNMVMAEADMVGYMEMRNDKSTINFNPTDKHVGKNSGELEPLELPHYTDAKWEGFLENLIQRTKNKINAMTSAQQEAMDTISTYRNLIADSKTAEEFNTIGAGIKILPEYCRFALSTVMRDRVAELGITFNKDTKLFEDKVVGESGTLSVPEAKKELTDAEKQQHQENEAFEPLAPEECESMDIEIADAFKRKTAKAPLTPRETMLLALHGVGIFYEEALRSMDKIQELVMQKSMPLEEAIKAHIQSLIVPQAKP